MDKQGRQSLFLLDDALFCPWIAKCLLYQESKIYEYTSFMYNQSFHISQWFLHKKVLCESFSTETNCSIHNFIETGCDK